MAMKNCKKIGFIQDWKTSKVRAIFNQLEKESIESARKCDLYIGFENIKSNLYRIF